MVNSEKLRVVGFCAGYGGLETGLEGAGVTVIPAAFSEIEAYAAANLLAKMEEGAISCAPIWTDLKTFPVEQFRGCVDLLTGGFPCQPFSSAGKRGGDEDPRHLFPYFKNFLDYVKPQYCFLENVDGIASAKLKGEGWADPEGTPVLLHVCRELERLGYKVATGCFNAEEVGAPHKRNRWFIYGELADGDVSGLEGSRPSSSAGLPESSGGCRKLGDPQHNGQPPAENDRGGTAPSAGGSEGANPSGQFEGTDRPEDLRDICGVQWPAGPGPGQYEYEEPRTIPNSTTKPELGGTIDGATSRVDATTNRLERIRMCGNGVCPQTATRAWITLRHTVRNNKAGYIPVYNEPGEVNQ